MQHYLHGSVSRPTSFALALALASSIAVDARAAGPSTLRDAVRVEGGRCLSVAGLVKAIAAWRGTDAVMEGLTVSVTEATATRARFVVRQGDTVLGEREIDAAHASCHELGDALALLVAVALDAAEASVKRTAAVKPAPDTPSSPGPEPAPTSTAPAPPATAPSPPSTTVTASPATTAPLSTGAPIVQPARALTIPRDFGAPAPPYSAPRLALEVTAGGGVGLDIVPARVAVVSAGMGLRIGPKEGLAGVVRGGVLATSTGLLPLGDGQVETRLAAGRLDVCALWVPGRAGLEACAGLAAGWLWAHGTGYDADRETGAPWAGAIVRLAGRLHVAGPLGLFAGADALVPVLAPRLQVQSSDLVTVAEVPVPPVGVGIFLGVAFTFP